METAEIRYRVIDFLKKHAPFHAIEEGDLLALAAGGRVRFHEPNEYILWQGEPHKALVFVIQQGTVSLWDESGPRADLRDVRGTGDLLGLERYNEARSCLYSARTESDTVLYGFPAEAFETHVLRYPHAVAYVTADARVTADYQPARGRRDPTKVFVNDIVAARLVPTCGPTDSVSEAARRLLASPSDALVIVDPAHQPVGVLTGSSFLAWIAAGGGDAEVPIATLARSEPTTLRPDASVTDAVLTMGAAEVDALAVTANGTSNSPVQGLVTARDMARVFGEQPALLLPAIRRATSLQELGELNRRVRAFTLESLTGQASVEWLARLTHLADVAVVTRILTIVGADQLPGCWCFCGSSGRAEVLTSLAPYVLVILEGEGDRASARNAYTQVLDALHECDYLPRLALPFDAAFHVATAGEWKARYQSWVTDPVLQETYRARSLFDVRPVGGNRALWQDLEATVMAGVDRDFVQVLANDCLASLPPLTFFQDDVVDNVGEHSATFRLEHSALRPLVDVGRVFGLAARQVMGRSTLERFATARRLLPEHEAIFREAAETLRVVLWQQGRVGISQGTSGLELPPALLSRHDRQVLKGGFRSILRLLEFTAAREWIGQV